MQKNIPLKHAIILLCATAIPLLAQDKSGTDLPKTTPLTRAIRLERMEEVAKHLSKELVNQADRGGYHPLTYAAYTRNNQLIEALLKAGADPNGVEANGKTALYVTANLANVEGLKILHRYKAKTPPGNALSPGRAAVLSSSLECLATLVKLYPDLDLSSGWSIRNQQGYFTEDSPEDPVSYATYHGFDDVARFLLYKKVRPTGRDFKGQGALHHAAINPRCSVDIVKMLLDAGCSPLDRCLPPRLYYSKITQAPFTPLDYAAISGNSEKLKLIALRLDPKRHEDPIRHAAHLAAAYQRENAAQYLFSLIGEKLLNYDQFLKQHKIVAPQVGVQKPAMDQDVLSRIMPRIKARPGNLPTQGSMAIISDPALRDTAALLGVELANQEGLELVERDQLDAIAAENALKGFTEASSKLTHQALDVIPARHLVMLTRQTINGQAFVRASVIESASGLITATHALPLDAVKKKEGVGDLAVAVTLAANGAAETGIGLSLTPTTAEFSSQLANSITRDLDVLLPHYVSNTPGALQLSRDQLQHLQLEKAIGADGSYWAAAWVIDGGIGALDKGQSKLTLRAIHAINKKEVTANAIIKMGQVEIGLKDAWNDLATKMQIADGKSKPLSADDNHLEKEAEILYRHAHWFYEANQHDEASKLMRACLGLGKQSKERLILALRAQIALVRENYFPGPQENRDTIITRSRTINPYRWADWDNDLQGVYAEYAVNYHGHPRGISHEMRQHLIKEADLFFHLAELASKTVTMNPLRQKFSGLEHTQTHDNSILGTHFPTISYALHELFFYAAITDHSMLLRDPHDREIFNTISANIEKLGRAYLAKIPGKDLYTLRYLLTRDYQHLGRHSPELLDAMLDKAISSLKSDPQIAKNNAELFLTMAIQQQSRMREMQLDQAAESWSKLQAVCLSLIHQHELPLNRQDLLYQLKASSDRFEFITQLTDNKPGIPIMQAGQGMLANHPLNAMLGMDVRLSKTLYGKMNDGALILDLDHLVGTAEYRRLFSFYRTLEIQRVNAENKLKLFLANQIEDRKKHESGLLDNEAWADIKTVFTKTRKLDSSLTQLLDELANSGESLKNNNPVLKLAADQFIPLAKQYGAQDRNFFAVYERAAITGDELWLPGMFVGHGKKWSYAGYDNDHAIQVISLSKKTVETIILPRKSIRFHHGSESLNLNEDPGRSGRIQITKDYVYFTPDAKHLFCVRRDNRQASEITLPKVDQTRILKLIDTHKDKNLMLLSMECRGDRKTGSPDLYQAILVEDDKLSKVLASNLRKPQKSPLDNPNLKATIMEFNGDQAWVGGVTRAYVGQAYNLNSGKWSKLGPAKVLEMLKRQSLKHAYDYVETMPKGVKGHYRSLPGGFGIGYWHFMGNPVSLNTNNTSWRPDIFESHMVEYIKVSIPEVIHPFLKEKRFPKPRSNDETDKPANNLWANLPQYPQYGWWISLNEAIKEGHYQLAVIGKFDGNYILGLRCIYVDKNGRSKGGSINENQASGGIWLAPESSLKAALNDLDQRYSRLVDFESGTSKELKHKLIIHLLDGRKKDIIWYERQPIELVGGGGTIILEPKLDIKDSTVVLGIARKSYAKKIDFKVEVGDRENPITVFESTNHELATADKLGGISSVYFDIPDNTEEVRLINNSPKGTSLKLSKLLLIPKE